MDTLGKIEMRLLEELYTSNDGQLIGEYSKYYESLTPGQSKVVVTDAIKRMLSKDNGTINCKFDESTFTLSTNS